MNKNYFGKVVLVLLLTFNFQLNYRQLVIKNQKENKK